MKWLIPQVCVVLNAYLPRHVLLCCTKLPAMGCLWACSKGHPIFVKHVVCPFDPVICCWVGLRFRARARVRAYTHNDAQWSYNASV